MKMLIALACAGLVATQAAAQSLAQSEEALRDYFEGKSIIVKLDMPASQTGIDVYADARRPLNFAEYTQRIKATGIAVRSGDSVMITRIKVKEKLIEFQLGGGGYGTMGDDTDTSVYVASAPKTSREKALERDVRNEPDAARKRRMQNELDDLRRDREREDQRNRAVTAAAAEQKKQRIAEQRLHGGSRFNIRYQNGVPPGVTPGGIMAALAEYAEFPFTDRVVRPDRSDPPAALSPRPVAPSASPVFKGMTWQQALDGLGKADETSDRMEGTLKVTTATFSRGDQRIQAEFVEGVLIRYSISSR